MWESLKSREEMERWWVQKLYDSERYIYRMLTRGKECGVSGIILLPNLIISSLLNVLYKINFQLDVPPGWDLDITVLIVHFGINY